MTWGAKKYAIIPYQELLGNYDCVCMPVALPVIIPYQELLGNYDPALCVRNPSNIIPYQELLGNYDNHYKRLNGKPNYTIPRAIREL